MLHEDWKDFGTASELEAKIGNGFKCRFGWIESSTDTVLILDGPAVTPHGMDPSVPTYRVYCWNRAGVRTELANLLGLPVHKA